MHLRDYLASFSLADLQQLAERRHLSLSPEALKSRQGLVRQLGAILERYDSVQHAMELMSLPELVVLKMLLKDKSHPGLTALAKKSDVPASKIKKHLEALRLWGVAFPEGDWEHIAVPMTSRSPIGSYFSYRAQFLPELKAVIDPPALERASEVRCTGRPGSLFRDLAELLARVARSRYRVTQQGRINRRDLRAAGALLPIQSDDYLELLFEITAMEQLLMVGDREVLEVRPDIDVVWTMPQEKRLGPLLAQWRSQPATLPYSPSGSLGYDFTFNQHTAAAQRRLLLSLLSECPLAQPTTTVSLAAALRWRAPQTLELWGGRQVDAAALVQKLLGPLYWYGAVAVDDIDQPGAAQLTPLAAHAFGLRSSPPLIPEEPRFIAQPNGDVICPPNLAVRTYFHLRRLTGEKKGAPEGVYTLNTDSLRRALDSGVDADAIRTFLERFSRTGLPSTVQSLLEATSRRHGKIRLMPAQYVLLTDDPPLMMELRALKTIEPHLGRPLTPQVALVDESQVGTLVRNLRQRGYAPLNESEVGDNPPLPKTVEPDERTEPPSLNGKRFAATITDETAVLDPA
jgi:hypothetical protein